MSREYRQAVRQLVRQLHRAQRAGAKGGHPADDQEQATLAALSPEVQAFVRQVFEDWHALLAQKRPRVVSKRIRKGKRSLPPGLEKDHFRWLCRFLGRWHRRHAGKCDVMSGWSSGETGDDTSGDEETLAKRRHKGRNLRAKKGEKRAEKGEKRVEKGEKQGAAGQSGDSEDTDGVETVSERVTASFGLRGVVAVVVVVVVVVVVAVGW